MPVVAFNVKDFEDRGYPVKRLQELLPSLGMEAEFSEGGEIKIETMPNRPDLLDFIGIVRALDHFTGKRQPKENFYKIDKEPVLTIDVDPSVKKIRPYIAGIVAENVDFSGNLLKYAINFTNKFTETYGRKRRKLALGIHNLDMIKGNITYAAAEDGMMTPLDAKADMSFSEILKKSEKGIEYGGMYSSQKKPKLPFIRDGERVLAVIPIIQCEQTRAKEDTKNIFIDITGTSEVAVENAANMIAAALIYGGATVYPVTVNYGKSAVQTPEFREKQMKMSLRRAELTLGVALGRHNIVGLANKMGHTAAKYGNSILFFIPPYRLDVISERDLIEDVAIAFGYDNITPLPVTGVADGLAQDTAEQENRLATNMVGLGYTEAINSILTNETANFENMQRKGKEGEYVQIADAKTEQITMVRTDIVPCLMQNLSISTNEKMPQRLFEIGRVFSLNGNTIKESSKLAFVAEHSKANFAEIRSAVEAALKSSDVEGYRIEQSSDPSFIEGRCAKVVSGGTQIGIFGEIHPKVLLAFGLEEPVVAAELTIIKEIKYEV
ncbi:MAG: phenylalanine--tRNA ligase subunit beta [Candidatus Micrarchaeales archaeon]|nr:phenylalanine--tRNA ligase subunit beta [Candidatus Micrarchaeales archaeon]